jgi:hypothetical protein
MKRKTTAEPCPLAHQAQPRKQWTEVDLQMALAAVRSKGDARLSSRAAERVYGVPATTLRRYIAGQVVGVKPGPQAALSSTEERALVEGLLDRARRGFPATRFHLKAMVVESVCDGRVHQFVNGVPSDKWISSFMERHSETLTTRKGRILDTARVNAVDKTEIEYFFTEYKDFLKTHPLPPTQIYNCDETGLDPQGGAPKRVITLRGAKSVPVRRGTDRENTSLLLAVSAAGASVPPLFIFKGTDFPSDLLDGAPAGSCGTVTSSAFVDSAVFEEWIDHFMKHVPPTRPILLVLDNHASHVGLSVQRKCIANDIHLLSFPPHTTHILQPLDGGCFRTFKSVWRDTMSDWAVKHRAQSLPRHCRAEVVGHALLEAFSPLTIVNSWRSTGMWPVDTARVCKTIDNTCTKTTRFESKYARFVAVKDPLPLADIDERGRRRLSQTGIDASGFRTYTIAVRDLDQDSDVKSRSPNKKLIKLGPKRLLTHPECMAEEERKMQTARASAETSLMRLEDMLSKRIEKEALKCAKSAAREQLRTVTANRKKEEVRQKEERRRKRELEAAGRRLQALSKPKKRARLLQSQTPCGGHASTVTFPAAHAINADIIAFADV